MVRLIICFLHEPTVELKKFNRWLGNLFCLFPISFYHMAALVYMREQQKWLWRSLRLSFGNISSVIGIIKESENICRISPGGRFT